MHIPNTSLQPTPNLWATHLSLCSGQEDTLSACQHCRQAGRGGSITHPVCWLGLGGRRESSSIQDAPHASPASGTFSHGQLPEVSGALPHSPLQTRTFPDKNAPATENGVCVHPATAVPIPQEEASEPGPGSSGLCSGAARLHQVCLKPTASQEAESLFLLQHLLLSDQAAAEYLSMKPLRSTASNEHKMYSRLCDQALENPSLVRKNAACTKLWAEAS